MKKDELTEITKEELLKKKKLLKGALVGFGIVWVIVIAFFTYLFITKGSSKTPMATFIPALVLPITLLPIFISLKSLNDELKSRNQ